VATKNKNIGSHWEPFFVLHILTLFLVPKLLNKKSHSIYLVRLRIGNKAKKPNVISAKNFI